MADSKINNSNSNQSLYLLQEENKFLRKQFEAWKKRAFELEVLLIKTPVTDDKKSESHYHMFKANVKKNVDQLLAIIDKEVDDGIKKCKKVMQCYLSCRLHIKDEITVELQ